ncbi:amino acid transporter [Planctomicrobium sp. SH661]|uniref:amino acid transporter n=1 Tax=Planctomicrobium sp. SH661 TaxID=3448124 RepID=UPI003F5BBD2A
MSEVVPPQPPAGHLVPGKPAQNLTPAQPEHHQSFWLWVLCLTGVDYFSTLAYQPSIAFNAAGRLAPLATIFLVLLTLFGALPVYYHIARKSPHGQGSIAMLQRLLNGWLEKLLVLVLLGFAATDFVITITLSSADAAEHLIHNPIWDNAPRIFQNQVWLTLGMLVALGALFLRGFREVIWVAVTLVAIFLGLNILLVGTAMWQVVTHPTLIADWWQHVQAGEIAMQEVHPGKLSVWGMVLLSLIYFPKLILGLSGFETGVAVMPLIKGEQDDDPWIPMGRIRSARRLLLTSALIMCILLLGSSIVVTLLIPEEALRDGGAASNRALAYLAHGENPHPIAWWCGENFGTLYDLSTVAILWFAGASALSGLLNLIPRFLPRYGMAPSWASAIRPLVLVIVSICILVTILFRADVSDQGAAYATGVMVLILSGCIAVAIERYRETPKKTWRTFPWGTVIISIVFTYATIDIILEKPDGLMIASAFVGGIILVSIASRVARSTELRVVRFDFVSNESKFMWETLQHLDVPVLAPHRPGARSLEEKERELRTWHHIPEDMPVVFVEVRLGDTSDFYQSPRLNIYSEEGRFVIQVSRCTATAPALAAIALALSHPSRPIELHFGWSNESPMRTNLDFLLFGEGNVPWLVHDLLRHAEPNEAKRPRVIIG